MNLTYLAQRLDLRRRFARRAGESVLTWVDFLDPGDRAIMVSIFHDCQRVKTVAAAARLSPDALRKRVRRLLYRIADPEFQAIAKTLRDLPPQMAEIARRCILQGESTELVAMDMGLAPAHVRLQRRLLAPLGHIQSQRARAAEVNS